MCNYVSNAGNIGRTRSQLLRTGESAMPHIPPLNGQRPMQGLGRPCRVLPVPASNRGPATRILPPLPGLQNA